MKRKSEKRWSNSYGYNYYNDDRHGFGYVHRAAGGGWFAAAPSVQCRRPFKVTKTLKDGKAFIEGLVKRAGL